jgi:hypothetical protein
MLKLSTIIEGEPKPKKRLVMLLKESQFREMARRIMILEDSNQIKRTYLLKVNHENK